MCLNVVFSKINTLFCRFFEKGDQVFKTSFGEVDHMFKRSLVQKMKKGMFLQKEASPPNVVDQVFKRGRSGV